MKKTVNVNKELEQKAKEAQAHGFSSYGKAQSEDYRRAHAGEIQSAAAYARQKLGYTSMRERQKIQ